MRIDGKIRKTGHFWAVEIPVLAAYTQGRSKKDAYEMARAWVRDILGRQDFPVEIYPGSGGSFELGSEDTATLVSLVLRRQREANGLSLAEVARRMHAKSRNAYARYEQGTSVPTVEKLAGLLQAVNPNSDFVLRVSREFTPAKFVIS